MTSFATSGDQVKIVRLSEDDKTKLLKSLPPADTVRWVIKRKAAVVKAVDHKALTKEEACERYHISEEELGSWKNLMEKNGVHALRTTRLQEYRRKSTDGAQEQASA